MTPIISAVFGFARNCGRLLLDPYCFERPVSEEERLSVTVKQLLADGDNWTTIYSAENRDEERVPIDSPRAVKWTLQGAIYRCYPNDEQREQVLAMVRETIGQSFDDYDWSPKTRWKSYADVIDRVAWPQALPASPPRPPASQSDPTD